MAYAFCVRYQSRNEFFSPPAGTSNVDINEAVAAAFNVPVGSFAIRRESEAGFFHAGLRGQLWISACRDWHSGWHLQLEVESQVSSIVHWHWHWHWQPSGCHWHWHWQWQPASECRRLRLGVRVRLRVPLSSTGGGGLQPEAKPPSESTGTYYY